MCDRHLGKQNSVPNIYAAQEELIELLEHFKLFTLVQQGYVICPVDILDCPLTQLPLRKEAGSSANCVRSTRLLHQ